MESCFSENSKQKKNVLLTHKASQSMLSISKHKNVRCKSQQTRYCIILTTKPPSLKDCLEECIISQQFSARLAW